MKFSTISQGKRLAASVGNSSLTQCFLFSSSFGDFFFLANSENSPFLPTEGGLRVTKVDREGRCSKTREV